MGVVNNACRVLCMQAFQANLSYRRINAMLQEVLTSTIKAGLPFERDEFELLARKIGHGGSNGSYWLGSDPSYWHQLAVEHDNHKAAISWEHWQGIRPWKVGEHGKRRRLYTNCWICIDGKEYKITSMSDEQLIACRYDQVVRVQTPDGPMQQSKGAPIERRAIDRSQLEQVEMTLEA